MAILFLVFNCRSGGLFFLIVCNLLLIMTTGLEICSGYFELLYAYPLNNKSDPAQLLLRKYLTEVRSKSTFIY